MVLHAQVDCVRDLYQMGIGAHVTQCKSGCLHRNMHLLTISPVSRDGLPDALQGYTALDASWKLLGMTPSMYTWGMLPFTTLHAGVGP